jgi:hypothetical protein
MKIQMKVPLAELDGDEMTLRNTAVAGGGINFANTHRLSNVYNAHCKRRSLHVLR